MKEDADTVWGAIGFREGIFVRVPYRIRVADTDVSSRIHWGSVFGLFEHAEVELWRSVGALDTYLRLPRVRVEVDFLSKLSFDDEVEIEARLSRLGRTSLDLAFTIYGDTGPAVRALVTAVLTANPRT